MKFGFGVSPTVSNITTQTAAILSGGGGGGGGPLNPGGAWHAYTYTGGDQTLIVPSDYAFPQIQFKIWGAGGGNSPYGAGGGAVGAPGGFVTGKLVVSPNDTIKIVVGQAGNKGVLLASRPALYGGGGAINDSIVWGGGQGGGYSGLFSTSVAFANAIAIAGGGGGGGRGAGGGKGNKGWGGGPTGGNGYQSTDDSGTTLANRSGTGGTQSAGGIAGTPYSGMTAGSQLLGGTGGQYGAGSGGGGYYGGGGASAYGNGGGGSCYWNSNVVEPMWYMSSGSGSTLTGGNSTGATGTTVDPVPQSGDAQYQAGVGVGGPFDTSGGPGLVQLFY